jgi:cell division protein FtsQ
MNTQLVKKRFVQAAWLLFGLGAIVLLGAAMQYKNHKLCTDVKVDITGADEHMFIDEKDILKAIDSTSELIKLPVNDINLRSLEEQLMHNPWVKNAELFFDRNQVLQINILEREPVARLFTTSGASFYIDSSAARLPLSDKLSARVPVFTNFPSEKTKLTKADSTLLMEVKKMSMYIMADSFWMAQIAQINITEQATFELSPAVGAHTILFGDANNMEEKFTRLYTFYKKAWLQNGIDNYESLNVQFNSQVIALKKGFVKSATDSLHTTDSLQSHLGIIVDTSLIPKKAAPAVVPKPAVKSVQKAPTKGVSPKKETVKKKLPNNTHSNTKVNTIPLSNMKPRVAKNKQPHQ